MCAMLELIATAPDSAQGAALVAALIVELADRYGTNLTLPYDAVTFLPPHGYFVVAVEDGRPLGCGGYVRFEPHTAELKRMYVSPEARGRGFGRVLLRHLEGVAFAAGYTRIVLETGTEQPEAIGLYRSAGYAEIPCFPPYAGQETSICMARSLV
jgi:GNAT superfamily N-acetyltransferase